MPPTQPIETQQGRVYRAPIIAAGLIVIALAGWFTYYSFHTQPLVDQTLRGQFVWNFEVVSPSAANPATTTVVVLRIAGVDLPAGVYPGSCKPIKPTSDAYLENELSGVLCRSGDTGTEIGVFKEDDNLLLKRGAIKTAEGRGENFTPITKEQI
jgi:hypothetical protein